MESVAAYFDRGWEICMRKLRNTLYVFTEDAYLALTVKSCSQNIGKRNRANTAPYARRHRELFLCRG